MNVDTRLVGYVFDLILNGKEYPEGMMMEPVDGAGFHTVRFSEDVPEELQEGIVQGAIASAHIALEHGEFVEAPEVP